MFAEKDKFTLDLFANSVRVFVMTTRSAANKKKKLIKLSAVSVIVLDGVRLMWFKKNYFAWWHMPDHGLLGSIYGDNLQWDLDLVQ